MLKDQNKDDADSVLFSLGQISPLAVSVLIERVEDVARSQKTEHMNTLLTLVRKKKRVITFQGKT